MIKDTWSFVKIPQEKDYIDFLTDDLKVVKISQEKGYIDFFTDDCCSPLWIKANFQDSYAFIAKRI